MSCHTITMAATGLTCSVKLFYLLFISILLVKTLNGDNLSVHKRFEYKYSFKPPYLAQKDGTVPFWEYGGSKSFLNKKKNSRKEKEIHIL